MARHLVSNFSKAFNPRFLQPGFRPNPAIAACSASTAASTPAPFEHPFSSNSEHTQIAHLPSGDTISYSAVGPPDAPALIYLHGFPCARLEGAVPFPTSTPIRVITPDRPGLGYTTHSSTRTLLDYPNQISQLAAHLGLDKKGYRVMGGSGGGPYALACAKVLPESECKAVGVLAGVGPLDSAGDTEGMRTGTKVLLKYSRMSPTLVSWLAHRLIVRRARDPDPRALLDFAQRQMDWQWKLVDWGLVKMSPEERELFTKDEGKVLRELVEIFREHFRQGSHGFMKEIDVLSSPWGFKLEDIDRKPGGVKFWYGGGDINTPALVGKRMAEKVKGSIWKEYKGETHFTVMENKGIEIMEEMMRD